MKLNGVVVAMLMLGSAALVGCKSAEEPAPAQTQNQGQAQECPSQTAEVAAPPAPSATDTSAANDDQQQPPKKHRRHKRGHRMGG